MNFAGKPFVGASIGYFSFIFLLTGRALTVSFGTCYDNFGYRLLVRICAHYNVAFSSNSEWVCPSQVLLSPPIVVYSPRVLPVYVYDAHADSAKNVRYRYVLSYALFAFLEFRIGHMYISLCSVPS